MADLLLSLLRLLVGIAVPLASFVTGLRATEPLWLWRRPRLLGRSLLAILVVVPLVEVLLAEVLSPTNPVVRAGLVVSILAIGIGPPALLKRTQAPKEVACYEIGLDLSLLILAVVYLPLAVSLHGRVFDHALSLPWWRVAQVVLTKALLPMLAGMAVARWLPKLAAPLERHAPQIVNAAMLVVMAVALLAVGRRLLDLGLRAWLVCAAIAAVAVMIGHYAGGPARETRVVLAGFSAMRFPALALLIISVVPQGRAMIPTVLAYVLSSAVLVGVYQAAMGRRAAAQAAARA
jgi:bile acid:Na+ symporter, BASS family